MQKKKISFVLKISKIRIFHSLNHKFIIQIDWKQVTLVSALSLHLMNHPHCVHWTQFCIVKLNVPHIVSWYTSWLGQVVVLSTLHYLHQRFTEHYCSPWKQDPILFVSKMFWYKDNSHVLDTYIKIKLIYTVVQTVVRKPRTLTSYMELI